MNEYYDLYNALAFLESSHEATVYFISCLLSSMTILNCSLNFKVTDFFTSLKCLLKLDVLVSRVALLQ
ncbi:hypothetical protein OMCYN_01184 [cyanobiont of Ornithocercus magnificus]|nr:hypothetical protein OMCYN_01184 [cyanobiont of Ornithocercus magnificus]